MGDIEKLDKNMINELANYMLDNNLLIMAEYDNFLDFEICDIDHLEILLNSCKEFIENKDTKNKNYIIFIDKIIEYLELKGRCMK